MVRRFIVILTLSLLITSCGGAASTQAPSPIEPPVEIENPTRPVIADTNTPVETPTLSPTDTAVPTDTPESTRTPVLTPTDTPLPTLVLPTEAVNAPARQVWDGAPTYPGDSTPG